MIKMLVFLTKASALLLVQHEWLPFSSFFKGAKAPPGLTNVGWLVGQHFRIEWQNLKHLSKLFKYYQTLFVIENIVTTATQLQYLYLT